MIGRRILLQCAGAVAGVAMMVPLAAGAQEPLPVVATFSILGDMVERIGGEHVKVTTLVGRNGDAHVYQPTPADARAVSHARLLVVNGLDFEDWLDRLIAASDFQGTRVVATDGIEPIPADGDHDHAEPGHDHRGDHDHAEPGYDHHGEHDHAEPGHDHHGDHDHAEPGHDHHGEHDHEEPGHHHHGAFDPHAWQSLHNAMRYVENITAALVEADPEHAATYEQNRVSYLSEIHALDQEVHDLIDALPASRRTVVTSHDAFQYFGRTYGLTFLAPQGISTESEASARDVAHLIEQIRDMDIRAVFVENITDPRLLEQIADETGATIGGTLYPGALSELDGPAPTYLDMIRHNARTLAAALTS